MAVDVAPPTAPENKAVAAVRGIPSFYQAVMAEMKKVTWPEWPTSVAPRSPSSRSCSCSDWSSG